MNEQITIIYDKMSPYEDTTLTTILHKVGLQRSFCKLIPLSHLHKVETCGNIIVTMGEDCLKRFCPSERLFDVRGTLLQSTEQFKGTKIIPTFSMERITTEWKQMVVVLNDFKKASKHMDSKEMPIVEYTLKLNPSYSECCDYLRKLYNGVHVYHGTDEGFVEQKKYLSFDIETTYLNTHITMIGLSHRPDYAIVIPFIKHNKPVWTPEEEAEIWRLLGLVMESDIPKVAHNAKFDCSVLWKNNNILVNNLWMDTMAAWHCCYLELDKNLGFVASMCLDVPAWKHTSGENMEYYCALDVLHTGHIAFYLDKEIDLIGCRSTFDLEMSCIEPAMFMDFSGIHINKEQHEAISKEICDKLEEIENTLNVLLQNKGVEPINYGSPKQLQNLLYVDLGFPIQKTRRKTKAKGVTYSISADKKAIQKLLIKTPNNNLLKLLLERSTFAKLKSTYISITPDENSRIYTSYNTSASDTGRWTSSENILFKESSVNLQNIPSRDYGSIIKKMYEPDEGYVLLQADYIQAEAVIMAYLIGDDELKILFKEGGDVHKKTIANMLGIREDKVTDQQRKVGKLIRHSTNYAKGAQALAIDLMCTLPIAKEYLKLFHDSCPQLKHYHKQIEAKLQHDRILITPLGRKRIFYGRLDDNTYRSAYAYIPQSTVGDLLNMSLVQFYNKYGHIYDIKLQLHDAIYLQVKEENIKDAATKLKECMTHMVRIKGQDVVLGVDFAVGKNWKEMKKYEF